MGAAVLILCNKCDLEGALSAEEISKVLKRFELIFST